MKMTYPITKWNGPRGEDQLVVYTGTGSTGTGHGLNVSQQRELDEWNKTYPNMKMTAKEFLSR